MASITKHGTGWRAFIRRKGFSKSATFKTKREAQDWAVKMEALVVETGGGKKVRRKFLDILRRYLDEVSVKKRGYRVELTAYRQISKYPIVDKYDIDESDVVELRDGLIATGIQGSSVNRYMAFASHACAIAVREWRWMDKNPFSNVSRPPLNPPRDRRVTQEEIDKICLASGFDGVTVETNSDYAYLAFLLAIETAMRAGEIQGLTWKNVDLDKRTAHLPMTKNGSSRTVPLSKRAIEIIRMLPQVSDKLFPTKTPMHQTFSIMKKRAGIENLHFHDTRHEAITRLSKRLGVLELARMVGHKRIQQLMTYYNETAEELAKKLD